VGETPWESEELESADFADLLPRALSRSSAEGAPLFGPLYTIERYLASGGMGDVLLARDRAERRVVLKLLSARYAENGEFIARLREECRAMGALRKPRRVAGVLAFFAPGELPSQGIAVKSAEDATWIARVHASPVLVMEYVPGPTLRKRLGPAGRGRALSVSESLSLGCELAKAIFELHRNTPPIEHRDLKPGNMKVARGGLRMVLLDLGLARVCWEVPSLRARREQEARAPSDAPAGDPAKGMSATAKGGAGERIGREMTARERFARDASTLGPPAKGLSLDYSAPEQLLGAPIGTAADVWAFACILVEMLTGRPPFADSDLPAQAVQDASHRAGIPAWRRSLPAALPKSVAELLQECLHVDPDQRPPIRKIVLRLEPFARARRTSASNIPRTADRLPTGRGPDVAALCREIASRRTPWILVEGLPGVGKSRIALAAAARCASLLAHRPWVICHVEPGKAASTAQELAAAVLSALQRIPRAAARIPDAVLSANALGALCVVLGRRRTLLLLDGADGPADALRELLSTVRDLAPETTVLVTRRAPLDLEDGARIPIDPLTLPDLQGDPEPMALQRAPATRLFLDVARAAQGSTTWSPGPAGLAAIARICRELGGMPWAIAAAAAKAGELSVEAIEERLLPLLHAGTASSPPGAASERLPESIWNLLSGPAQTLLSRLSLLPREFSIQAAEAICWDPQGSPGMQATVDGQPLIHALWELSRLRVIRPVGHDRFRHVEPLRRHAAWMLALPQRGERADLEPFLSRSMNWFMALVERGLCIEGVADSREREPWLLELDRELESIEGALETAQHRPGGAQRLARAIIALRHYWWSRGPGRAAWEWCARAVARLHELDEPTLRCDLLKAAAVVAMRCNRDQDSEALTRQALAEAEHAHLHAAAAALHGNLAIVMRKQERFAESRDQIHAAQRLARRCGARSVDLNSRILDAVIHKLSGDLVEARTRFDTLLAELGESGHRMLLLSAWQNLGEIDVAEGRWREARARFVAAWRGQPRPARMDRARAVLWMGISTALEPGSTHSRRAGLRRIDAAEPLFRTSGGIADRWLEHWLERARGLGRQMV
jgi:non-specific serine/threonine protein kinase